MTLAEQPASNGYDVRLWRRHDGLEAVAVKLPPHRAERLRWRLVVKWPDKYRSETNWVAGRTVVTERFQTFKALMRAASLWRVDFNVCGSEKNDSRTA